MSTTGGGVAVELTDLTRTYGSVKALDGLNLKMEPGEFIALLGPSGCGKTTALRILAGLDKATSGTVTVDGRDLTSVPANKRDMGMVFQAYSLFPHLTASENVEFGLKMRGSAKSERGTRAAEMLDLVGLSEHAHKYASEMSGGQQQRVALARALAIRPRVLLLDEPLTALDASLRDRLRSELNRLLRSLGITAIYVTHDQAEAMELGDRIVVMRKGAIAQIGTPREVYFAPQSRFVAEFVGAANIIEAPVAEGHLVLPGGRLEVAAAENTAAATAMIRPETIGIIDAAQASLCGLVDSVSFIGDKQRIILTGASDKPLVVDAPNTITARVGERVGLSIAPEAVRLLPKED